MLAKGLRLLAGIALIPVVIGYSAAFAEQLLQVKRIDSAEVIFLLGVTAYLAFHALITAPSRAYVLGHELTHAAATWVSGGAVKGTAFIALAPHMIPVYALLWTAAYGAAGLFWDVRSWLKLFLFGLGVTLTFHLVFTVNVLKEKQSDLEVMGPLLALGIIVLANVTLVSGVLSMVIPDVRFGPYLAGGFQRTQEIYQAIATQLF